jgi:hypothetical protein
MPFIIQVEHAAKFNYRSLFVELENRKLHGAFVASPPPSPASLTSTKVSNVRIQ